MSNKSNKSNKSHDPINTQKQQLKTLLNDSQSFRKDINKQEEMIKRLLEDTRSFRKGINTQKQQIRRLLGHSQSSRKAITTLRAQLKPLVSKPHVPDVVPQALKELVLQRGGRELKRGDDIERLACDVISYARALATDTPDDVSSTYQGCPVLLGKLKKFWNAKHDNDRQTHMKAVIHDAVVPLVKSVLRDKVAPTLLKDVQSAFDELKKENKDVQRIMCLEVACSLLEP
ncbi:MAG: hypothetical protein IT458_06750 [Planctomycetes bacterium]|nr:hypothetical protein [Planctomycetota bacterium]